MPQFDKFISTFDQTNTKGKQFEKFCKWFLENDPFWKNEVSKVWLWDEWPDRWGADLGIDLVFQHKNGDLWAVQAKCYDPNYPVTKKDIDSFLSESNRPKIQQRLLMASTDVIGPNARKVCENQDKRVAFFLYSDFLDSKLDYPTHINKLGKAKLLPKPKPRPHQADAVKNVIKGFKTNDRGQLIMACGTGKTFTTLWIKEKLKAQTTLILLPSLSLLAQTLKEWTYGAKDSFLSLAVCSDETVTKGAEEDAIAESIQDLSFPVSSDPKVIAKFLRTSGTKVIFSTYQSSPMVAKAMKLKSIPALDLVICDEAHRCAGRVGSQFTTILDDKKIRTKKKLFTTATPRTYSSNVKKAAKDLDMIVTGMDDEKVFGRVFHKLSFGDAINNKPPLLTDYQVVIVGVNDDMIKEWIDERKLLEIEEGVSVDAETLATQIAVLKAIKDYNLKRLITFHGRVSRAEHFSRDIQAVSKVIPKKELPKGIIKSDYVSGKMPTNKRKQKLDQLKQLFNCDRQILSNARCLSEGVDVPALDGIAIIDPRRSQVDIVQTVGRAIRLSENKQFGVIVLPVFIDNAADPELAIERSNFKPVYDVLNALKSHDENLAYELDEMRTELGRKLIGSGPSKNIPKVILDIPKALDINFSKNIKTILLENTTTNWNCMFSFLEDYYKKYNSTLVPYGFKTVNGLNLGHWVNAQRAHYQKLIQERKEKLDSMNFFTDNVLDFRWNEGFEHLKTFYKKHKTSSVARDFTVDGFRLGQWVGTQRQKNRLNQLSLDRKKKLDKLNFIWGGFDDLQWNEGFEHLKSFYKKHKTAHVPQSFITDDGYNLGYWVVGQKINYKKNKLSIIRKKKLEKLNFVWVNIKDKKWDEGYKNLKIYFEKNGNSQVPTSYKSQNGFKLGQWVSKQKHNHNSLTNERIKKLKKLNFSWQNNNDRLWDEGYKNLKIYFEKNGNSQVPTSYKSQNGFRLGQWVGTQRQKNRLNQLSLDRKKKLDKLNFIWKVI